MYEPIIQQIKTHQEAHLIKQEIRDLIDSLYDSKETTGYESKIKQTRAWLGQILTEVFLDSSVDKKEYLLGLEKEISTIDSINIALAFDPDQDFVEKIHALISADVKEPFILEITYDPELIGGILIDRKGIYKDFSLKQIFTDAINDYKASFDEKMTS